jgi:hypothetical protein
MRLPQSILRYLSAQRVHFLTIGVAITLGMLPVSADAATPQLTCTPTSLNFGAVVLGQTEALQVSLTNNGETSVTVSAVTAGSSEFASSNVTWPLVLSAGQSVSLTVSFTPAARGWTDQTMSFSSNASNPTLALAVGGAGVRSEFASASPSTVSFGQVTIGSSSTVPVVIKNAHLSSVTLSQLRTTGAGFSTTGPTLPVTLAAGQSVTLNVTFTPQAAGTNAGSIFVSGPALALPLTGTGIAAPYSVNLFWNSSSGVAGYNVYRSTAANGTYSRINSNVDPNTAYTDGTVVSGQTYYYAATAVNSSGQESARSTPPVSATVP